MIFMFHRIGKVRQSPPARAQLLREGIREYLGMLTCPSRDHFHKKSDPEIQKALQLPLVNRDTDQRDVAAFLLCVENRFARQFFTGL